MFFVCVTLLLFSDIEFWVLEGHKWKFNFVFVYSVFLTVSSYIFYSRHVYYFLYSLAIKEEKNLTYLILMQHSKMLNILSLLASAIITLTPNVMFTCGKSDILMLEVYCAAWEVM